MVVSIDQLHEQEEDEGEVSRPALIGLLSRAGAQTNEEGGVKALESGEGVWAMSAEGDTISSGGEASRTSRGFREVWPLYTCVVIAACFFPIQLSTCLYIALL